MLVDSYRQLPIYFSKTHSVSSLLSLAIAKFPRYKARVVIEETDNN
jgi:hypothetical protein